MTFTFTARRAALVLLAVLALFVVYAIGASRSEGAPATASTMTGTAGTSLTQTSSKLSPTTQPSTTPAIGGPGITVGGRADVAGTPDTLRLDLSVVATGSSVSQALASANRSADAVQKSLLANGVARKDLQTSGLNIAPDYDYSQSGAPRLKGYQVSESVSAKLRNLGRAGDAIGKAVSAGGNAVRVNGISLDLEDTGALVSAARDKAFADAKAKAAQYAKAAGRALGDVVSIAEDVSTLPPIPMQYDAQASAAFDKASLPIQPGSQNVSVSVTVVFSMP
ncbi:MAG: SIMPL domain-containing protein [Dermatophilaceae bacterium]